MATMEEMNSWLPPTFLSHLDETFYNFPDEFPYEFDSITPNRSLNSPVESTSSAIEAESSDEEEFFAGSAQLHDSRPIYVPYPTMDLPEMKKWAAATSPQSIVSGLGVLSGRSSISSNRSPTGYSHFPSPLTTPCFADDSTLDLINVVAGQVARLKMNYEATKHRQGNYAANNLHKFSTGSPSPPRKPSKIMSPVQPDVSLHPNQFNKLIYSSIAQHQQATGMLPFESRSIIDEPVRQDKLYRSNFQKQNESIRQLERGIEYDFLKAERTWSSPQSSRVPLRCRRPNPPLFHCPVSYLSSIRMYNCKRESSGTGVFLPRPYGNPPPREKFGFPPFCPKEVVPAISKNNPVRSQLHGVLSNDPLDREIFLPREWTY